MPNKKRLRYELKYYINYHEYLSLRMKVRELMSMDTNAQTEDGYHIRSLHFDDIYDTALKEKTAGVKMRDKYRVRIYNHSDDVIKLERKSKFGQVVAKDVLPISREEYEGILVGDYAFLSGSSHTVGKDFYRKVTLKSMQPRIIVDYLREAYVYPHGDVRVTFDKNLMAGVNSYDIFDPNLITVDVVKQPAIILEIKYSKFLPAQIKSLLQLDTHTRSAISKYVICRENGMNYHRP